MIVPLVQADRRFIEHVEHSAQTRTDLRGQANALSFATGEASRIAIQREIAKADGIEKLQPLHHLAAKPLGNESLAVGNSKLRAASRALRRAAP